ncbi:protein phosphatase 1, regulatory (inhibitor) subunit 14Aa [Melanotaenia boesemani]|uniref:protein phosphatase 1, regulatory (inhibitor) subunit 14Aa n=1 Tax=Melanotaenia boesemani TaxID=1250792 RepID=UPI001C03E059|nr:protein phosphatase 1, regulatory (inhibitor) subunit 14Aa [Melanotaenia boesemani]
MSPCDSKFRIGSRLAVRNPPGRQKSQTSLPLFLLSHTEKAAVSRSAGVASQLLSPPCGLKEKNRTNKSEELTTGMAAHETGTTSAETDELHLSELGSLDEQGSSISRRQARVTVKYNRRELQRRLDVEKWIDESLDRLYKGQESDMPEEVNIDGLIDLPNDEERVQKLKELLHKCSNSTETFIMELVAKLEGVHKQEELQTEGIEHPVICHSYHRHEPYHFNNPQHHPHRPHHHFHHTQGKNQSL